MPFEQDADQCQDDTGKPDHCEIGCPLGSPADGQSSQKDDKIKKPGYDGPCLLLIPADVRPASELGGDGTCHNSQREQRKPQDDRLLIQMIEKVERRQFTIEDVELFRLEEPILNEIHDSRDECDGKSDRPQHTEGDMKPQGFEDRLKRRFAFRQGCRRDERDNRQGDHEGSQHMNPMTEFDDEQHEDDHPGEKRQGIGKTRWSRR